MVSSDAAQEASGPSLRDVAKDIAFGSIAGMVSEVFEYPFDLAKVRLQSQLLITSPADVRFRGPLDCLTQTWKGEGFTGLYRGLPAPLLGAMAETASLFVAYSAFQNVIRSHHENGVLDRTRPLSIPQLALAAAGAGFVTSFILTPIELVKCKMQVQMMGPSTRPTGSTHLLSRFNPLQPLGMSHRTTFFSSVPIQRLRQLPFHSTASPHVPSFPGPAQILKNIVQTHGLRGLWLGHTGTMFRETGGSAVWFAMKEWSASAISRRRSRVSSSSSASIVPHHPPPWISAVSGAIAGGVCVLAIYPADTVKSAIQTEEELRGMVSKSPRRTTVSSTFWNTFASLYRQHGLRGLYSGCGMTVARAVPSSGIIFVVYDGLSARFG